MKAAFNYEVVNPEIALNQQRPGLLLRFQTVVQRPRGPQLSEKHIHLTMTLDQAMLLLAQLQRVQRYTNASVPTFREEPISVPPAKDRN